MSTQVLTRAKSNIAPIFLGALWLAIFSRISIPLPFTPVPLALQPQIALLLGLMLGARRGSIAVITFVIAGAIGLPVLATGTAGLGILLGPKGGYLVGYVAGAALTGLLKERMTPALAMLAGNGMIFLFGAMHLSLFVGLEQALLIGVLPFVLGDLVKVAAFSKVIESHSYKLQRLLGLG